MSNGELHGVAIAEGGGDGCWKTYCPACSWAAGEWVTVCTQPLVARTWPPTTELRPVAATPATLPARLREAAAAVERVRDDMTTHPGAYAQVIDALTLLRRWLAADPEDPAAQAVARALEVPR